MARGKVLAPIALLVVFAIGNALDLELSLKVSTGLVIYVAVRILFRGASESPVAKGKRLATAASSQSKDRTFGNVPLSQQSPSAASPSGPFTPDEERLRQRVARARQLGNTPLSQQSASKRA
jgi:hypothetical protein